MLVRGARCVDAVVRGQVWGARDPNPIGSGPG